VFLARKLVLAHFWVAFAGFLLAIVLGEWQMYVRSPLHAWVNNPEHYYRSVTAHGTVMAYVLPTLVAMGFGYAITELSLKQPLIGVRWAWAGFWLVVGRNGNRRRDCRERPGVGPLHVLPADDRERLLLHRRRARRRRIVDMGRADVGQLARVAQSHPGATVPLAMFGNVTGAYLWAWTSVGAAVEVLVLILPVALGLKDTIDAGLSRVLFSWTLARRRLFLADADVHRLLHDRPARDRGQAL
jgi:cytochrome c oxidase subunit 1